MPAAIRAYRTVMVAYEPQDTSVLARFRLFENGGISAFLADYNQICYIKQMTFFDFDGHDLMTGGIVITRIRQPGVAVEMMRQRGIC